MNVYFVSGMSANCSVFDKLVLPEGFEKKYIEWYIPDPDESLEEYSRKQAQNVDASQPFILVGYSLGGLIVQEMNKFVKPDKNILIASMKGLNEIPAMFRLGRIIRFARHFPIETIVQNKMVVDLFARLIYSARRDEASKYMTYTDAVYTKWALERILEWKPSVVCHNLYHIHGSRDQVFPVRNIKDAIVIKKGDHLMVIKRHKEVSKVLQDILLGSIQ